MDGPSTAPVAIVSGGTYGIGRGITLVLARAGWNVVAFAPDARQVGSAAAGGVAGTSRALAEEDLGPRAVLLDADVTRRDDIARVVATALERHGRIDGLVNNAAIRPRATILETDEDTWRQTLEVNLTGPFLLTMAVLPTMVAAGRGAIVNLGSAAGWGRPGLAAYGASKGGVHGLSQSMAYDLQPHGIRVNTVIPGRVNTGMIEDSFPAGEIPAGRFPVTPADVGAAVEYLLSERAAQVNGAVLNVGGHFMQAGRQ